METIEKEQIEVKKKAGRPVGSKKVKAIAKTQRKPTKIAKKVTVVDVTKKVEKNQNFDIVKLSKLFFTLSEEQKELLRKADFNNLKNIIENL